MFIGTEKTDFEIIEDVLNGNVNAFEIIVKRYEKMLYNLAAGKMRSRENAQDIVQESFLRAYKMLRSYRTDSAFSTWIYRICRNLIYDFFRKNKNARTISLSVLSSSTSSSHSQSSSPSSLTSSFSVNDYAENNAGYALKEKDIADNSAEPSELIIKEEKIAKIREIIESLPDDLRDIIILRDINDYSYNMIAEMLDIEIGTVKSRLSRAREKLKKYILENNKDGELF